MENSRDTVLVTGGTGFLGGWSVAALLDQGYDVRTTVRDLGREQAVRDAVKAAGAEANGRLTVLAADLTSDAGRAGGRGRGGRGRRGAPPPPRPPAGRGGVGRGRARAPAPWAGGPRRPRRSSPRIRTS